MGYKALNNVNRAFVLFAWLSYGCWVVNFSTTLLSFHVHFSSFSFFLFNLDSNDPSPGHTLEFLVPTSSGKVLINEFSSKTTTLDHDFHKVNRHFATTFLNFTPRATECLYS